MDIDKSTLVSDESGHNASQDSLFSPTELSELWTSLELSLKVRSDTADDSRSLEPTPTKPRGRKRSAPHQAKITLTTEQEQVGTVVWKS
jgi:hypothetical protein